MTEEHQGPILTENQRAQKVIEMVSNTVMTRSNLLTSLFDPRRNINQECGYPDEITSEEYKLMYRREGIARRVVNVYPEESWSIDPEISENEETNETEFEKTWEKH